MSGSQQGQFPHQLLTQAAEVVHRHLLAYGYPDCPGLRDIQRGLETAAYLAVHRFLVEALPLREFGAQPADLQAAAQQVSAIMYAVGYPDAFQVRAIDLRQSQQQPRLALWLGYLAEMADYQKQLDNQLDQAREREQSREFLERLVTADNLQRELDSLPGGFFL